MAQPQSTKLRSFLITDYASELARSGTQILSGAPGTCWVRYESGAMVRLPTFHLIPPESGEISRVFWQGRVPLVGYLLSPNQQHPANAWLYVCTDKTYVLDKLAPTMRRNVSRGLRELRIAPLTSDQLLAHGVQAFCDTRYRVGLSDGKPEEFYRRFTLRARCRGHVFLGGWKDNILAAFLSIAEVDDWAEIEGCFSMDRLLPLRPNDTLLFCALSRYLSQRACRIVSYGVSSIQRSSNESGLHAFKMKVGFEAQPVHRAFVIHPLLRPLANRLTLRGLNAALWLWPSERRLKKLSGVLSSLLERNVGETGVSLH